MLDWLNSHHITIFTDITPFNPIVLDRKIHLSQVVLSHFKFLNIKYNQFINNKQVFLLYQLQLSMNKPTPSIPVSGVKRKSPWKDRIHTRHVSDIEDLDTISDKLHNLSMKPKKKRILPFDTIETKFGLLTL